MRSSDPLFVVLFLPLLGVARLVLGKERFGRRPWVVGLAVGAIAVGIYALVTRTLAE